MHIVKKHHTAIMYGLLICNYLLTHLSPSLPLSRAETVSWVQQCVSRCTTGLRQVYRAQYWDLYWTRAHGKEVVASNEKAESGPNAPECSSSVKRGALHLSGHDSFTTLRLQRKYVPAISIWNTYSIPNYIIIQNCSFFLLPVLQTPPNIHSSQQT